MCENSRTTPSAISLDPFCSLPKAPLSLFANFSRRVGWLKARRNVYIASGCARVKSVVIESSLSVASDLYYPLEINSFLLMLSLSVLTGLEFARADSDGSKLRERTTAEGAAHEIPLLGHHCCDALTTVTTGLRMFVLFVSTM